MKITILLLLAVSAFAQNSALVLPTGAGGGDGQAVREIPEKIQTDHALASLERLTAYMQYLLEPDKKLRSIEEEMKKACGGEIKGEKDGRVSCVAPAPTEGSKK